jgi:N-methylhydantoinase B
MLEMLGGYGAPLVKGVMRRMIADCSRIVADRLLQIPDGAWSERMYVTGVLPDSRQSHQEVLTLTKRGDQLVCSNAGTSAQGGAGNSTYGFLRSSVVGALATALAWDQLGCAAGVANHVVFEPVAGTRSVARWPAAVSAHLSTFITLNVAALVTSKMVLSGAPQVRSHAYALGGLALPLGDVVFGLRENGTLVSTPSSAGQALLGGCLGAFAGRDGIDSGGSWWLVGSSAGNVEESEESGVALILFRSENPDSGGPGTWRGGNSVAVGWVPGKAFMAAAQMTFADPSTNPTAGLAGGYYGLGGNFLRLGSQRLGELISEGRLPAGRREIEELAGPLARLGPKELVLPVPRGDCIVVEFNGSGGFGDPLARDPDLVAADVRGGRVSRAAALRHYGVVVAGDGAPDHAGTASERRQIRARRLEGARRFAGEPAPGPATAAVVVLAGAAGSVDLARCEDASVWCCSACGELLGPASENFKIAARYQEFSPPAVDEHLYPDPREFGDGDVVVRQYYCPGCASLLAQEFCRRGDEPWHDYRIDATATSLNV